MTYPTDLTQVGRDRAAHTVAERKGTGWAPSGGGWPGSGTWRMGCRRRATSCGCTARRASSDRARGRGRRRGTPGGSERGAPRHPVPAGRDRRAGRHQPSLASSTQRITIGCKTARFGRREPLGVPGEQSHIQCGRVTTVQQASNTATDNTICASFGLKRIGYRRFHPRGGRGRVSK